MFFMKFQILLITNKGKEHEKNKFIDNDNFVEWVRNSTNPNDE